MTERADGYRITPRGGPNVRTDIVEVHVFRQPPTGVEFLQLLRSGDPLAGTWHCVMGHIETEESAAVCAARELLEELGLELTDPTVRGVWALEQVHPYFIAAINAIVMSPRFACEVAPEWSPRLNDEHQAARWVTRDLALMPSHEGFMWPGQRAAVREIADSLLADGSLSERFLRVQRGA